MATAQKLHIAVLCMVCHGSPLDGSKKGYGKLETFFNTNKSITRVLSGSLNNILITY